MSRKIGPYSKSIDVGQDGKTETRSWSFGSLFPVPAPIILKPAKKSTNYSFHSESEKTRNARLNLKRCLNIKSAQPKRKLFKKNGRRKASTLLICAENPQYNQAFQQALVFRNDGPRGFDFEAWRKIFPDAFACRTATATGSNLQRPAWVIGRQVRSFQMIPSASSPSLSINPIGRRQNPGYRR